MQRIVQDLLSLSTRIGAAAAGNRTHRRRRTARQAQSATPKRCPAAATPLAWKLPRGDILGAEGEIASALVTWFPTPCAIPLEGGTIRLHWQSGSAG